MKKITRYSVAYCDTFDLATQYGTWGNCWDTKEEARHFIKRSWNIVGNYGEDAFLLDSQEWLVVEPVQFTQYNIFERLFMKKHREERITHLAAQGSYFIKF